MYFTKSLLVLAGASLLQLATAGPLQARASNEGVYLSNCNEFEPGILYSEMDYYSNAKGASQNQQHPDATASVSSGSDITWEGHQVCGFFSASGETFCSNIDATAHSRAVGAYAGSAHNNEQNFNCYVDNGRTLYTATGIICKSIYYCFDA